MSAYRATELLLAAEAQGMARRFEDGTLPWKDMPRHERKGVCNVLVALGFLGGMCVVINPSSVLARRTS